MFKLLNSELRELMREVNGSGGNQSLLRQMQARVDEDTAEIDLDDGDLSRIRKNIEHNDGDGGFQSRLKKIFGRVLGLREGQEELL